MTDRLSIGESDMISLSVDMKGEKKLALDIKDAEMRDLIHIELTNEKVVKRLIESLQDAHEVMTNRRF